MLNADARLFRSRHDVWSLFSELGEHLNFCFFPTNTRGTEDEREIVCAACKCDTCLRFRLFVIFLSSLCVFPANTANVFGDCSRASPSSRMPPSFPRRDHSGSLSRLRRNLVGEKEERDSSVTAFRSWLVTTRVEKFATFTRLIKVDGQLPRTRGNKVDEGK